MEPNPGKQLEREVNGARYARFPVRTHVITDKDDMVGVIKQYVAPNLKAGDYIFISERIVATSQGRAYPIKDIKPSRLAIFLLKFVYKSPYGIGIGSPWTMELAIREAGVPKILLGALVAALTKPFGIRGAFYKIVGPTVASIDGPADYVLPPYNRYAKLGPLNPDKVARQIKEVVGCETVIVDANDLGVAVLGKSTKDIPDDFCKKVFKDNPLGQSREQTPIAIVRKV
jgi:hypothetical protein